jgi:uncharacterized integral membrane protein
MLFLILLTGVAVVVSVGVLQNAQTVTVSFMFWQFETSLALVILAAAMAGLMSGVLISWTRALQRWRHRLAEPAPKPHASGGEESSASGASLGTRIRR